MSGETHALGTLAVARAQETVSELAVLSDALDPKELAHLVVAIDAAPSVFLAGHGRSGLIARAFAMRLMHIGLRAWVVGETATPAIHTDDLLVCISATGTGAATTNQLDRAQREGAQVAVLSVATDTPLALRADLTLVIPSRTQVPTTQHAGSLFEQGALIAADAVCAVVQCQRGATTAALTARHANLQ